MLAQNDRAQIMLHCAKFLLLKCQPLGRHLQLAAKKGRWEMVWSSLSVEIFGVHPASSLKMFFHMRMANRMMSA